AEEDRPELLFRWSQALVEAGELGKGVEKWNELRKKHMSSSWAKQKSKEMMELSAQVERLKEKGSEGAVSVTMAQVLFKQAEELLQQGKEAEAVARLDELVAKYPQSEWGKKASEGRALLLYKRGHDLMGQGKLEEGQAKHAELMEKYAETESAKKAAAEAKAREKTPPGMVYVPPGEFIMGSDPDEIVKELTKVYGASAAAAARQVFGFDDETPRSVVYVDGFYIDKCEVTNADYKKFVDATNGRAPAGWPDGKIPEGKENHPVTHVTWHEAAEYAKWAGKRLPTEAEWEKAARGTDGRLYPWGAEFDSLKCNTKEADVGSPTEVGKYLEGQSPYGCLDMAGNVYEWTADWYEPYPKSSFTLANPGEKMKVLRSSSFRDERIFAHAANRFEYAPSKSQAIAGFRCAQTP
ncbi:MAG: hypothetical protein FJ279_12410, partial [Planctomycetes bacterium]|nr:hypothetical protein [Planctomycetota bacterium]